MSFADFAARLGRLAAGEHRAPGSEAAAAVARSSLESALSGHVRTGNAVATSEVTSTPEGVHVAGPEYLKFIPGALEFDRDAMRAAYGGEVHKIMGGS